MAVNCLQTDQVLSCHHFRTVCIVSDITIQTVLKWWQYKTWSIWIPITSPTTKITYLKITQVIALLIIWRLTQVIALLIPFVQTLQVLCAELLLKKKEVQNSYLLRVTAMFYTILRSWKNSEKKVKEDKRNALGYSPANNIWDSTRRNFKDLRQEIYPKLSKRIGITGFFFQWLGEELLWRKHLKIS